MPLSVTAQLQSGAVALAELVKNSAVLRYIAAVRKRSAEQINTNGDARLF